MACPKLSIAEKAYIQQQRDQPRINAVAADDSTDMLADVYGYEDDNMEHLQQDDQVSQPSSHATPSYQQQINPSSAVNTDYSRTTNVMTQASCNVIHPVPLHFNCFYRGQAGHPHRTGLQCYGKLY